jgi:hypothetical protein
MHWQDIVLASAGVTGGFVAVVHGVLVQRWMVRPIGELAVDAERMAGSTRRMVPLLLHFSTAAWFLGGLAMIAAAVWFGPGARLATALFVGGLYLYGALGNLWATRGRHPGWLLMAVALALIGAGVS